MIDSLRYIQWGCLEKWSISGHDKDYTSKRTLNFDFYAIRVHANDFHIIEIEVLIPLLIVFYLPKLRW